MDAGCAVRSLGGRLWTVCNFRSVVLAECVRVLDKKKLAEFRAHADAVTNVDGEYSGFGGTHRNSVGLISTPPPCKAEFGGAAGTATASFAMLCNRISIQRYSYQSAP